MITDHANMLEKIKTIPPNTKFRKPNSFAFTDGWSVEKNGLRYKFGSSRTKIVKEEQLILAFCELSATNQLTTHWFKSTFPNAYKNAPCNFTTIGGVFVLLGLAKYERAGLYSKAS